MKTEPSIDSLPAEKIVRRTEWHQYPFERTVKSKHRIARLPAT
jgi:hypothetical protein